MSWLLVFTAVLFILMLFGGGFYVTSPSRGESADESARRIQARMKARPFLRYYGPLALAVVTSVFPIREVVAAQSIQEKAGLGVLALTTPLFCMLLVRFWRWPKGILPKRTR